jgi:methyl-accepting chemotaxis protein
MWIDRPSLMSKISALVLAQMTAAGILTFMIINSSDAWSWMFMAGGLALMTVGTIAVLQRLLSPLKVLAGMTSNFKEGHSDMDLSLSKRKDEIGIISRELERLSRHQLERALEEAQAREEQQREAETIARDLHVTKAEAAYLKAVVDALDSAVRRLAVGDLTVRIDRAFPTEYEGLRADFNNAVQALRDTLSEVGLGARTIAASGAELEKGLADAARRQAYNTGTTSLLAHDVDALAQVEKERRLQEQQLSAIVHNASLDMRRPKEAMGDAISALQATHDASAELGPAAQKMIDAAFQANMLAVNLGIEASTLGEPRLTAIAEELRDVAAQASGAAILISAHARETAEAAECSSKAGKQAGREWDAMSVYMTALREHIEALGPVTAAKSGAVAAISEKIAVLVSASKDQGRHIEMLAETLMGFSRAAVEMDQQASRFAPVTVLTPGGVTVPESVKKPGRRAHLRLVKS